MTRNTVFHRWFGWRARLAILVLAAAGPLTAFILYQIHELRQRRVDEALHRAYEYARLGSDGYEDILAEAKSLLELLARVPEVNLAAGADCNEALTAAALSRRWVSGLWVVPSNGRVACSNIADGVGMDLTQRDEYRQAIAVEHFLVSNVFVSKLRKIPTAVATLPIINAAGQRLLIAVTLDLTWFGKLSQTVSERANATVLLLDGAGEIVASASSHNDPTTSARAGALASRPSGMFEAADNLGRPTFWGVVPLAGSPLRLAVGLDQATVLAAYHRGTRQAAVLLAFTVLLTSSLIAFAGSGFFANPMRKLDRLLHLTLENMDQGIIAVDQNGRLPICNKRATQLLGLPRDFMSKGPSANEVLAYQASTGEFEALSTDVQGKLNPCLSGGIATSYERTRPDGTVLEIRTVPIPEGGWVRTYSDVTARSRAATELLRLATHDGLTGLCNRRHFDASLQIEVARSCRSGPPLSLLMIDVDHFKQYNDRYGHVAGDACLRRIAQLLHDACRRPSDLVARYGGEEFAVLLPETPLAAALQLAENVRRLLDAAALPHAGGQHGVVTVSIGAATLGDFATASAETFVAAADACLYAAKSAGRNQVHPVPCAEPLPLAS